MDDDLKELRVNPDLDPSHMSGVSLLRILRANKRFVALFTTASTLLIMVYSLLMRQTFEANAKIVSNETKSNAMSSLLSGVPAFIAGGAGSSGQSALSMSEILQSRTNAEYIIKTCGLDTLEAFRTLSREERIFSVLGMIDVDAKRTSGIITVNCSVKTSFVPSSEEQRYSADLAARICNTAVAGLDIANRLKTTSTARKTRLYIERVLSSNAVRLDSLQKAMISFQNRYHIFTPDKQAEALVTNAVNIGTELAKAETELRIGKEQFQDNTPYVRALEAKVRSLQSQFSAAQNGGVGSDDKLSIPVGVLPEVSMGFLNLVRDIKILEQVNAYLESQRMQESIQEERDVPTIQVIDPAQAPEKRSSPARVWMVLLGGLASLLISVFIAIARSIVPAILRHAE